MFSNGPHGSRNAMRLKLCLDFAGPYICGVYNLSDDEPFNLIVWKEEESQDSFSIVQQFRGFYQKCYDLKIIPGPAGQIAFLCQCEKYLNDVVLQIYAIEQRQVLIDITLCFPFRIFAISSQFVALGGRDNILNLKLSNLQNGQKIKNRGFLTNDKGYQHLSKVKLSQTEIAAFHRNDKFVSVWKFI